MLAGVRDRVAPLVTAGKTESDVVAAKPTAAFDAKWGNGFLKPDAFAALVYQVLKNEAKALPGR
jgi:hypothetical protein